MEARAERVAPPQPPVPKAGSGIHKVLCLFRAKLWGQVTTADFLRSHAEANRVFCLGASYRQRMTELRATYGMTFNRSAWREGGQERTAWWLTGNDLIRARELLARIEDQ